MQQAQGVGCIVQVQQGTGSLDWMLEFMQLMSANKRQGVEIKLLFLYWLNPIAHSISAANTKDLLPNQSNPHHYIHLHPLLVRYGNFEINIMTLSSP
ncbi:hypothetical protein EON65_36175 [archaeon]|nr:MAG: hypothetical protein EON65_36175 [archaeon]